MIGKISVFGVACVLALPLIHPFGAVREQRSQAPLPDLPLAGEACQNCHSEKTVWPFYSRIPIVSWILEKDVADARRRMNLSDWDLYSNDEKRDLLARIAAEVRSHRMPPARYTFLHPEARLSDTETEAIYQWTKARRRNLRMTGIKETPRASLSVQQ